MSALKWSEAGLGAVNPSAAPGASDQPGQAGTIAEQASPAGARLLQTLLADRLEQDSELLRQARFAHAMGSTLVASVLEAGHRHLARAPRTEALIRGWVGNPSEAALAMRFNAAIHALARCGQPPILQALYQGQHSDFDAAIAQALSENDDFIAEAMRHPTQTNEVGRAGALVAALMTVSAEHRFPFELLELGTSCGLNLNLSEYAYDLGGVRAGVEGSPVVIAPQWHGAPPLAAPFEVLSAKGIDLNPLDPTDPATAERLMSYIWADASARLERLEQALGIARLRRPRVEQGHAVPWLMDQLRLEQPKGVCRAIFHSMVLQYFSPDEREAVRESISSAGAEARADRPLAWISFEWTKDRSEVQLLLTSWPGGGTRHLATCHPYGSWIDWHG
jgi:hypothetical protein